MTMITLTSACSGSSADRATAPAPTATGATAKIISPASLTVGQAVSAPKEKPVLTLTGKISTENQNGALVLDRPTLERLGVQQVRLYEPWVKANMDFRGVWLQDLLGVAVVKPDATSLHIVALDDYAVNLSLADVRAGGIMVATRAGDGSMIPIDKGGPTRIVFMDGVKAGVNPDQWIWSIKTIDVV